MTNQLYRESARPILDRIDEHIKDCAAKGNLFSTTEVMRRIQRWAPLRDAVIDVSRTHGQLGLPAVIHYGLLQFVHAELGRRHPRLGIASYSGLPVAGQAEKMYKDSERLTAREIRDRVVPLQRHAYGQMAEIRKYLDLADILDAQHADTLGDLLVDPKFEVKVAVEA